MDKTFDPVLFKKYIFIFIEKMRKIIFIFFYLVITFPSPLFAQGYCIPVIGDNYRCIHNFTFHTLENIHSGISPGNYIHYPDSVFTTTVNMGETYPVSISNELDAGTYGMFYAWIDYNNDSIFDAAELVYNDTVAFYSAWGFVTIPNDSSYLGKRRMRIMNIYSLVPDPCIVAANSAGETEDYEINIAVNAAHPPTYCHAFNVDNMDNFILDDFELNTLTNFNSGSDSDNYIFYPDTIFTTVLTMGNSYNVSLAKDIFTGNTGSFAMWIDLDNDLDFSPSEMLISGGPGIYQLTGTVNIPVNPQYAGIRRLRARSQWSGGAVLPYGLNSGSETEDYLITIAMPTGLNQLAMDIRQWTIYPNPVRSTVFFLSSKNDFTELNAIIRDKEGKIVYRDINFTFNNGINVSALPPGIYCITVFNNSFSQTTRFVKL